MQISRAVCGHVSLRSGRGVARARHTVLIRSIDPLRNNARCGVGSTHNLRQQPDLLKSGPSPATILYQTDGGSQAPRFQLTSQPDPVLSGDWNMRRLILSRTAAAPPRSKTN